MIYDILVVIPQQADDIQMFLLTLNLNAPRSQVLEKVFGWFNSGSGEEHQDFLKRKCRSFSVNDFVKLNGEWFQCRSRGWDLVEESLVRNQIAEAKALCGQGNGQVSMWSALSTLNHGDYKFEGTFKG
jgi:hypothetical protein